MFSFRRAYIFAYNLFQFCGHTWILANTVARFFMFGRDALADTFYSVGFVMSLCQLLSVLELFHIADGIEKARLLPRFIQVVEKNLLLIMVIMLEGIQAQGVVWVQFFLWNILDLLRYPHELLRLMETPSTVMLWSRYTLWIPLYVLSAATEGFMIYRALLLMDAAASHTDVALLLISYLPVITLGSVCVYQLLKERQHQLEKWNRKMKRS
ncbi:unnamed protein product [Ophioblennius macclurei]